MSHVSPWLPPGKGCAILFSIDDVHPSGTADGMEAGGDLASGMLGHLARLVDRHPRLRTSLCVTPDWRPRSPSPTRKWLARLPLVARHAYLAERWPAGRMRLDRHPAFCSFLAGLPRTEIVPHGLHHIQRGFNGPAEFERLDEAACRAALRKGDAIFRAAGLAPASGHAAPGWIAPPPLRRAIRSLGLKFVASARDVMTPVDARAVTAMSGLAGLPLIFPALTAEGLVHIPTNFQATSDDARAFAVLEAGGLLSIKAHAAKRAGDYVALDGLDGDYAERLDGLLRRCAERFGDSIWWTGMEDIADRVLAAETTAAPRTAAALS